MKLTLTQVIERLKKEPPTKVIKNGWSRTHSWRGSYDELAFRPHQDVTVSSMLEIAESAIHDYIFGYKGGEFLVTEQTPCNITYTYGDYNGEDDYLTEERLEEILK